MSMDCFGYAALFTSDPRKRSKIPLAGQEVNCELFAVIDICDYRDSRLSVNRTGATRGRTSTMTGTRISCRLGYFSGLDLECIGIVDRAQSLADPRRVGGRATIDRATAISRQTAIKDEEERDGEAA